MCVWTFPTCKTMCIGVIDVAERARGWNEEIKWIRQKKKKNIYVEFSDWNILVVFEDSMAEKKSARNHLLNLWNPVCIIKQRTLKNTLLSKGAIRGQLFRAEPTVSSTLPPFDSKQPSRNKREHNGHPAAMPCVRISVHRSAKLDAVEVHQERKRKSAAAQWETGTALINYQQKPKHASTNQADTRRERKRAHRYLSWLKESSSWSSDLDGILGLVTRQHSYYPTQESTTLTARFTLFRYTRAPSDRATRGRGTSS